MKKVDRKKILQLRESSGLYGAERVVIELSKELQIGGYQVWLGILSHDKSKSRGFFQTAKKNGIPMQVLSCRGPIDLKTLYLLRRFIIDKNFATVQSHGYKSNFYALIATWLTNVSLIATCHPWSESEYSLRARLYEKLDLFWLKKFNRIVAISEQVREKILNENVPEEKVSIIENGIDVSRFKGYSSRKQVRKMFDIPTNSLVVGTVGRLSVEKGYAILIDVFKELVRDFPDLRLIIVGEGSLRGSLEKQVHQSGLNDSVNFMGISDDMPRMLALMDIFVLPSLGEGLPMALLEAMAAKVPVVATRVGDIPKVISHGTNGFLVPSADKVALKEALSKLLRDENKREFFAKNGYFTVSQDFSSQNMARKYVNIYQSLFRD